MLLIRVAICLSLFALCLGAQGKAVPFDPWAADKWPRYQAEAAKAIYIQEIKVWLEAEGNLKELATSDYRRLFVLNRLISVCDEQGWDQSCAAAGKREAKLAQAQALVPKIVPRDMQLAGELLELSRQFYSDQESGKALALIQESLDLAEKLEGPRSVAASQRYLETARVYQRMKEVKLCQANLVQAIELQTGTQTVSSLARFEFFMELARYAQGSKEDVIASRAGGMAWLEIERHYPPNSLELLEPYREMLTLGSLEQRPKLKAAYLRVLKSRHGEGSAEYVSGLTALANQVRFSRKGEARELLRFASETVASSKRKKDLDQQMGDILSFTAQMDEQDENITAAAKGFEQAALLWAPLEDIDKAKAPDAWLGAASNYLKSGNGEAAERCFRSGLDAARMHAKLHLAYVCEQFGTYYLKQRRPVEASLKLEMALSIWEAEELNKKNTAYDRENSLNVLRQLVESYELSGRQRDANVMKRILQSKSLDQEASAVDKKAAQSRLWVSGGLAAGVGLVSIGLFVLMGRRVEGKLRLLFVVPAEAAVVPEAVAGDLVAPVETEEAADSGVEPHTAPPAIDLPPEPQALSLPANPTLERVERFCYHGTGIDLFAMRIFHLLVTILTLGVFSFWGKTRVRRYLCAQAEFLGDRFCFHGTGGELLRGWLKGVPLLGVLFFFPRLAPIFSDRPQALALIQAFAGLGFLILWPIARVGSYRYRMNRMSWRGIRFRFHGKTAEYFWISFGGYFLATFTWGIYLMKLWMSQRRNLYANTSLGDRWMFFSGSSRELFWAWIFAIPMMVGTLGLGWFWWSALWSRYCWAHTTIGEARFRATPTGAGLAWLWISNVLLWIVTLGLGSSWASMRTVRYWSEHLELVGNLEENEIRQDIGDSSGVGESFADYIGLDFGF